jgi:hypothetical protein
MILFFYFYLMYKQINMVNYVFCQNESKILLNFLPNNIL